MSKFFEVASKDDLIDVQDISGGCSVAENESLSAPTVHNPSDGSGIERSPSADPSIRQVSLRASVLTPVFPFFDEADWAAAEQYRIIRTKILHSAKHPRMIVISSPSSGDGKTITAINIAASLSLKENLSILLVDADLRRPMIADLLGISGATGLADVLSGRVDLKSAVVRAVEFPKLSILPAGDAGHTPAELLHSERWSKVIEQFRKEFDLVIVDATPVALVADYEILQHISDATIIVIRPDHTNRGACMKALQSVPKEKLVGVVVNCARQWWFAKPEHYRRYNEKSKMPLEDRSNTVSKA